MDGPARQRPAAHTHGARGARDRGAEQRGDCGDARPPHIGDRVTAGAHVTLSPIARTLLRPLGLLYGGVMLLRRGLYRSGVLRSRRLPGAVISVGNLTVGGTGKTPMVLWIAERLAAEGHRPAILTRGYAGFGQNDATAQTTADEVAL